MVWSNNALRNERRVGATQGQILVDARRVQQLGRIADAARIYRDLQRQYLTEQAAQAARGSTLDDLVTRNFALFEQVAAAEDALFAAVDQCGARQPPIIRK